MRVWNIVDLSAHSSGFAMKLAATKPGAQHFGCLDEPMGRAPCQVRLEIRLRWRELLSIFRTLPTSRRQCAGEIRKYQPLEIFAIPPLVEKRGPTHRVLVRFDSGSLVRDALDHP